MYPNCGLKLASLNFELVFISLLFLSVSDEILLNGRVEILIVD